MKTFTIWGIPPHKKYTEDILFTKARTIAEASKACEILETEYNCRNCRIQIINLSENFDLKDEITKAINT